MPMDSFAFHGTAAVQVMPLVEPPPSGEQRRKSAAPWRDPVRLSQSQLDRFIRHHEAFLGRRPGGKRLMLRHAVLEGLTLAGHDLSEADLGGAQVGGRSDDEADDTQPPPPKKGKATEEADEEVSLPAATPSIANVSFGLGMPKRRRA